MITRLLARSRTPAIGLNRRSIYLSSDGGFELLQKDNTKLTKGGKGSDALILRILGSRKLQVPVVELIKPNGDISTLKLDIASTDLPVEAHDWIKSLRLPEDDGLVETIERLWNSWIKNDLLRITTHFQPGQTTQLSETEVVADDFALYRQPHLESLVDQERIHPLERQAAKDGLFYHKSRSGGNIGCFGYGAGVAMSTQDALRIAGGKPANFLDGGGGATKANVRASLELLFSDPDVQVIFLNSFGGLTKMDLIAEGLVEVLRKREGTGKQSIPIVARLRGTGEEAARQILNEAKDLKDLHYIPDLKEAAATAVRLSGAAANSSPESPTLGARRDLPPVVFSRHGQYEKTISNLMVKQDDPVMILGVGKASSFHNKVAQDYGTNIVGATAPGKGGHSFLDRPVFGSVSEGVSQLKPRIASIFVPPRGAAHAIIECIEAEIPLIVSVAEGVPHKDQLRVQQALRSQSRSRLVGANCPGVIYPHIRVKLGIQPLSVHRPGFVGLASRSGTLSYELANLTKSLGLGQSAVFGLGGDPFPGTRTWETLRYMIDDPLTQVICLVGEIGGQMEEEAAEIYEEYVKSLAPGTKPKPAVGFIAGTSTTRGLTYGHAGAVWWDESETAQAKKDRWRRAGIDVAATIADVGPLLERRVKEAGLTVSPQP